MNFKSRKEKIDYTLDYCQYNVYIIHYEWSKGFVVITIGYPYYKKNLDDARRAINYNQSIIDFVM